MLYEPIPFSSVAAVQDRVVDEPVVLAAERFDGADGAVTSGGQTYFGPKPTA